MVQRRTHNLAIATEGTPMAASAISDYIAGLDETLGAVSAALTAHLDTGLPGTVGQLWHGHPVWMNDKTPVAGFKAYPKYVTFMLWRGQAIDDPSGTLSPSGSAEMATLKISTEDGFEGAVLDDWLAKVSAL